METVIVVFGCAFVGYIMKRALEERLRSVVPLALFIVFATVSYANEKGVDFSEKFVLFPAFMGSMLPWIVSRLRKGA